MIDFSRIGVEFVADCYWIGHKHNQFIDDSGIKTSINSAGSIIEKYPLNIMTAGYENSRSIRNNKENKEYNAMDDSYRINFGEECFYQSKANGCVKLYLTRKKDGISAQAISMRD